MFGSCEVVKQFEAKVADIAGARYGVSTDTCTAALFLTLKYLALGKATIPVVELPARTYHSVPAQVLHAGYQVRLVDYDWSGQYRLQPLPVWDSALRFCDRCHHPGEFTCLSFHYRKHLPIGRGGMILTDDPEAARWLGIAKFNGRDPFPLGQGQILFPGWHMYMEPERAARGLSFLERFDPHQADLVSLFPNLLTTPAYQHLG